jgi:hypothetical protein
LVTGARLRKRRSGECRVAHDGGLKVRIHLLGEGILVELLLLLAATATATATATTTVQ